MIKLAFKNFISSNGVKIGLLFLLITGLVSVIIGKQFLEKQTGNAAEAAVFQKEHIARNVQYHPKEIGLLLYYIKFSLINETKPINSLSIGQRDVNSSIQSVTIRGLEAQKYDADLQNPSNLLLGNIDFSFVLIYLFPLFIIAFTYNIISEEKESGTWKVAAVQSNNLFGLVLRLFAIRLSAIIVTLLVILLVALVVLNIPVDGRFFLLLIMSFLYILFWFGVSFWIASLGKSSSYNAVLLLSVWISLIVILPAVVNSYLVSKYPVPEALETTVKQRKGYHEKWDMDKKPTMDQFYAHYPEFKKFPLPEAEFSWLWYYAMQQAGDDDASVEVAELRKKLGLRNTASIGIARFIPTVHMQVQLDEIAKSGLTNQLAFMDQTSRFHEKMRLYFYPKIFSESAVNNENWAKFKVETFSDNTPVSLPGAIAPLLVFTLLLAALGWVNFRKNIYRW
ncbi:DUF3526 domain-containing protein [Dyadobacter diqingensis]|uniref:DUF3526 domain-containing protein n=1 Tax=Dyadobacter diqingensis TaxID=2938121 RepID=UPI0020C5989B|nr:DUF3526 domain-containing protein [Dyadobacter diqingensis]